MMKLFTMLVVLGILACLPPVGLADETSVARASFAFASAGTVKSTSDVKATACWAHAIVPKKEIEKAKPMKTIKRGCCSPACTCGCNEGVPCDCPASVPVRSHAYPGLQVAPVINRQPVTVPLSRQMYTQPYRAPASTGC